MKACGTQVRFWPSLPLHEQLWGCAHSCKQHSYVSQHSRPNVTWTRMTLTDMPNWAGKKPGSLNPTPNVRQLRRVGVTEPGQTQILKILAWVMRSAGSPYFNWVPFDHYSKVHVSHENTSIFCFEKFSKSNILKNVLKPRFLWKISLKILGGRGGDA